MCIRKDDVEFVFILLSAPLDMYGKYGWFQSVVITWTTVISSLTMCEQSIKALAVLYHAQE